MTDERSGDPYPGGRPPPPVVPESPPYQPPAVSLSASPLPVVERSARKRRSSGQLFRIAGGLAVIGLLLMAPAMALVWPNLIDAASADRHDVPGSFDVDITDPGSYTVFVRSGFEQQTGFVTTSSSQFIATSNIEVLDPSEELLTTEPVLNTGLQLGNERFASVVSFEAATVGVYRVSLDADPPTTAVVSKSIEFPGFGYFGAGALGTLLFTAGLVTALIAFFRRREERAANPF